MDNANNRERIAIVLLIVTCYLPSMWSPFRGDDILTITENPSIQKLDLGTLKGVYTSGGRPLVNVSLALNYAIGGLDPFGYHVANVCIHAATALVLFEILCLLFGAWMWVSPGTGRNLAMLAVLLWALNPIHTDAVSYVVMRAESLCGLFFATSFYCLLRMQRCFKRERLRWEVSCVLACLCAMLTKEVAIVLPLLLILWEAVSKPPRLLFPLLPHLALWSTCLVLLGLVSDRGGTAGFHTGMTVWDYAKHQPYVICCYLWQAFTLWPQSYGQGYCEVMGTSPWILGTCAAILSMVLLWAWFVAPSQTGYGVVWFFIVLAPSSSIVPIATDLGADRRIYIASMPIGALAVLVFSYLTRKINSWADTNLWLGGLCGLSAFACFQANWRF